MDNLKPGQIVTFYSYKGGTGRSMALANVACLLAQKWAGDQKVLMIDWDLEAPGLHRFFQERIKAKDQPLEINLGLIDLFYAMKESYLVKGDSSNKWDDFFDKLEIEKYILETSVSSLYLMIAGRFDSAYPTRVSKFDWEDFFNQNPWLISEFAKYLAKKFRFILIDSRTGFTDISSICTSLMPERLVLVFTPNRQSLIGALDLAKQAANYRKRSDDLRPLIIFPLVSRVENAEEKLLEDWRFGNKQKGITGYQPQFESILKDIYQMAECNLTEYFDDVVIQHVPRYSYGEEIAVLSSRRDDRLSLVQSYERLTQRLVEVDGPWEVTSLSTSAQKELLDDLSLAQKTEVRSGVKSKKPLRVFLCHASQDKPLVRDLYQRLNAVDWIEPWLDEEKLLPGQDWNLEIEGAVEASDIVLVCFSNSSVSKEGYIQKEIRQVVDRALEKPEGTTFIIPVRFDNSQIPSRLNNWQYLDYFPKERRESAYQRLLKSLEIRAEQLGMTK